MCKPNHCKYKNISKNISNNKENEIIYQLVNPELMVARVAHQSAPKLSSRLAYKKKLAGVALSS